ncbi:MAG: ribonuclease R [Eubacteriales bacterium]|nr:ribonuclease R [Eubacteriales bacterium]MDY3333281.1 ribonuclease R [Gallibacter sp.]
MKKKRKNKNVISDTDNVGNNKRKNKNRRTGKNRKSKIKNKAIFVTGVYKASRKGFGFVELDRNSQNKFNVQEVEIFIASGNELGAMDGDKVKVELLPAYMWGNSPEGAVVKILDRFRSEIIGTFSKKENFAFVIPENTKIVGDIFIKKKFFSGAKTGDKVAVEIITYPTKFKKAEGKITSVIAKQNEANADIKALIRDRGLMQTFPSTVMAHAKAVTKLSIKDELKNRVDLRNKEVITIDGRDSKDFDDAVSVEITDKKEYILGVHIADVSYYVEEDSALDVEAMHRGNSVYLLNEVVPMLPEELSNGICSLNPNEDRLTMTCEMIFDSEGLLKNYKIYESVINSSRRWVYDDVSDILEEKDNTKLQKLKLEHDNLFKMYDLAQKLSVNKRNRGAIDFNIADPEVILDDRGKVLNIVKEERRIANKIIEEFMLSANEAVADFMIKNKLPAVYRVHPSPKTENVNRLFSFLDKIGVNVTSRLDIDDVKPTDIQNILTEIEGQPYESMVNSIVLRTMEKAVYEEECRGHFGLSLKKYLHFTSPIRRYSDLFVHRVLREYLRDELTSSKKNSLNNRSAIISEQCSKRETEAVSIERDVVRMKMVEYMEGFIGKNFDGIVSGVSEHGIYVELENGIEGMVRLASINNDYYIFEPELHRIVGEKSGKKYTIGDSVRVKLIDANKRRREIDFEIV